MWFWNKDKHEEVAEGKRTIAPIKAVQVGNTIVAYIDGDQYTKVCNTPEESVEVYKMLVNVDVEAPEDVINAIQFMTRGLTPQEEKAITDHEKALEEAEKFKHLHEWLKAVADRDDENFVVVPGGSLMVKGINITIPPFLIEEFMHRDGNEEDTQSLINFWKLLSLNSDPRCREDLYRFLTVNGMQVTPSGYFVAYRNVAIQEEATDYLAEFVESSYIKIKGYKKSPKNYLVYMDSDDNYYLWDGKKHGWKGYPEDVEVGILADLHESLPKAGEGNAIYTDNHTMTMTIKVGEPVKLPREKCDADPDRSCSNGLHLGNKEFMSAGSFGNVGLICLCNPMHVVAVPYADGRKLRCCEYLPIAKAEYGEDGKIIPVETATFEYDYQEYTLEDINRMLATTKFESLKDHKVIPMEIDRYSLLNIRDHMEVTLDEMNDVVSNRVIQTSLFDERD
jgi:hypothetical protein